MQLKNKQLFIRFKNIPENEISGVYDGDCCKIQDEFGVSCYQFIKQNENYNIILSSLETGFLNDLIRFIERFEKKEIPAYLIEAEQVEIGNYSDPVVKNIKIIKEIEITQLAKPKPKYKLEAYKNEINK